MFPRSWSGALSRRCLLVLDFDGDQTDNARVSDGLDTPRILHLQFPISGSLSCVHQIRFFLTFARIPPSKVGRRMGACELFRRVSAFRRLESPHQFLLPKFCRKGEISV